MKSPTHEYFLLQGSTNTQRILFPTCSHLRDQSQEDLIKSEPSNTKFGIHIPRNTATTGHYCLQIERHWFLQTTCVKSKKIHTIKTVVNLEKGKDVSEVVQNVPKPREEQRTSMLPKPHQRVSFPLGRGSGRQRWCLWENRSFKLNRHSINLDWFMVLLLVATLYGQTDQHCDVFVVNLGYKYLGPE